MSICTYGEMRRMGTKLGKCDVKHHTRTPEIRPKVWRKSIKCSVDTASAERKSNRGVFTKQNNFIRVRLTSTQIRGWKVKLHELSVNIRNKDGERGEKKKEIKHKHGCF